MEIKYKANRGVAPVFWLGDPPSAETIAANAQAIADWLEGLKQTRVEIARKGGFATKGISTPAKRRASRANGRKGGRPKKGEANARKQANPLDITPGGSTE